MERCWFAVGSMCVPDAVSMVRENLIAQLANIKTHPSVRLALEQEHVALHGWVYNIETGSIDALDGASG